jgi:S-adenosylmethionine decarboxylase proenzyme
MKYEFKGRHYIASFKNCQNTMILSTEQLKTALEIANTTILSHSDYSFENGGYTCVFLLRESHCSIHTYPEHHSIFIDLFTCGDTCNIDAFHARMLELFKPSDCKFQIITRE